MVIVIDSSFVSLPTLFSALTVKLAVPAAVGVPLISPVVMSSLINTRERAVALEVRGFAAKQKKTYLADRTPHRGDTPITVGLLAMIAAALLWRIVQCL